MRTVLLITQDPTIKRIKGRLTESLEAEGPIEIQIISSVANISHSFMLQILYAFQVIVDSDLTDQALLEALREVKVNMVNKTVVLFSQKNRETYRNAFNAKVGLDVSHDICKGPQAWVALRDHISRLLRPVE